MPPHSARQALPTWTTATLRSRLILPQDPVWNAFLAAASHDIYHTPEYVGVSAPHDGGKPRALYVEGGSQALLLPLVLRETPGGGSDATSPYGYPGPILRGREDGGFLVEAMFDGARLLRREGIISLFVRSHPILSPSLPEGIGIVVEHGPTVAVDLAMPEDALWAQLRKSHRRDIEKAVDAGHQAFITDDDEAYATFVRLYRETMTRVHAGVYYHFDDSYFEALRARLNGDLRLAVVSHGGSIIAAGLYTERCGIVQAHLSATDVRFGSATALATKALDWFMIGWSQQRGATWFSLGGGRGAWDDSLLLYKAGFSPIRKSFHTLRAVLDSEQYHRLVVTHSPTSDPRDMSGYFPLYREPKPRTCERERA